eukprot:gene1446-1823_t
MLDNVADRFCFSLCSKTTYSWRDKYYNDRSGIDQDSILIIKLAKSNFNQSSNLQSPNQTIEISDSVTMIKIKGVENCPLSKLSRISDLPSLTSLSLGDYFDEDIPIGFLPETLTDLSFGYRFNSRLGCDVLPKNLTRLSLGYKYCWALPSDLPISLTSLELGPSFDQPIPNSLMIRLENLVYFKYILENHNSHHGIPMKVTHLVYEDMEKTLQQGDIPNSVVDLELSLNQPITEGLLPDTIEKLEFGFGFNSPIHSLPSGLKAIKFNDMFNQKLKQDIFPRSIKIIEFGTFFNQPLSKGVFPDGVTYIRFGNSFHSHIEAGVFPRSLRKVVFGNHFNQKLSYLFYSDGNLEELELGEMFNQYIVKGDIPSTVHKIVMYGVKKKISFYSDYYYLGKIPDSIVNFHYFSDFNKSFPFHDLPPSLNQLYLYSLLIQDHDYFNFFKTLFILMDRNETNLKRVTFKGFVFQKLSNSFNRYHGDDGEDDKSERPKLLLLVIDLKEGNYFYYRFDLNNLESLIQFCF